jgi:hypothetical protein
MAARKRTAIKAGGMPEAWRERIQTAMLTKRLEDHAKGDLEMTATQIKAAEILLKKVAPDLQSIAIGQDPDLEPLAVKWIG